MLSRLEAAEWPSFEELSGTAASARKVQDPEETLRVVTSIKTMLAARRRGGHQENRGG